MGLSHGSRLPAPGSRLSSQVSRLTSHVSRLTPMNVYLAAMTSPDSVMRYARPAPELRAAPGMSLRIATFNLFFAKRIDRAIAVARAEPNLAAADVLALQEADETAAHRIAEALGLGFVYYPALRHPRTGRNFGPALLARWPVEADRRLDLPHTGLSSMPRIAIGAGLRIGSELVTVYVVHFGTMREMLPLHQNAQARMVLRDAAGRPGPAVVAGDLNRKGIGRLFEAEGWHWVTRDVGRTHLVWSFDHVFLRGFDRTTVQAGSVHAALAASDHRAVWARIDRAADPRAAT